MLFSVTLPLYFLITCSSFEHSLMGKWPRPWKMRLIIPISASYVFSTLQSLIPGYLQIMRKIFLSCGCFECLELPSYSSLAQMFKDCLSHARPAICIILDMAWGEHISSSLAPRCLWSSENDVQLGCLSRSWEMKGWHRYRTRWHCTLGIIFSDKLGLRLWILAFACYSHSH